MLDCCWLHGSVLVGWGEETLCGSCGVQVHGADTVLDPFLVQCTARMQELVFARQVIVQCMGRMTGFVLAQQEIVQLMLKGS